MTYRISLDCGCSVTLVSDGEQHRPMAPEPCEAHMFLAARSTMLLMLLGARVRVKVIEDDKQ